MMSASSVAHHSYRAVTPVLVIGILAILVVIALQNSFATMWRLWHDSSHLNGLLVIPVSAVLVWMQRRSLSQIPMRPSFIGAAALVAVLAVWLVGRIAGLQVVEHIAAVLAIPAFVTAVTGGRMFKSVLFPLLFLLLAVPLGESLLPFLMIATADISTFLLRVTGLPVLRTGQYIILPGGEFFVADVCAGLRYLQAALMLTLLVGYLNFRSFSRVLLLVIATLGLVIVANGFRAYVVMAVASATDMKYLAGRDHILFGWLLFGALIVFVVWVAGHFSDIDSNGLQENEVSGRAGEPSIVPLLLAAGTVMLASTLNPLQEVIGGRGTLAIVAMVATALLVAAIRSHAGLHEPDIERSVADRQPSLLTSTGVVAASVAVLFAAPIVVQNTSATAVSYPLELDLVGVTGCDSEGGWRGSRPPIFAGADFKDAIRLRCGESVIQAFVASYRDSRQGSELISSANEVYPRRWDGSVSSSTVTSPAGHGLAAIELQDDGIRWVRWYWYEIDGQLSRSPVTTKALQLLALVTGRPSGGSVVVLEQEIGAISSPSGETRTLASVADMLIAEQRRVSAGEYQ